MLRFRASSRVERPPASSPIRLLSSRFVFPDRRLPGRAQFFSDRIVLTWWTVRGRRRRTVFLADVEYIDYHPLAGNANLSFQLQDEVLKLRISEAHRWRELFENWLAYDVLPSAKLARDVDEAAARSG